MRDTTNKNSGSRIIRAVALVILVLAIIVLASAVTVRKDSSKKYSQFIENADKVDVLLLGSSHMLNGVNPAQLYSETGITAYNMGKPGGMLPESYWTYRLARTYMKPKCVVIDIWSLDRDYKYLDQMDGDNEEDELRNSISLLHDNMDVWPLSKTKAEAVFDLLSKPGSRAEFLFPFSLYHSRWSSLSQDDFVITGSDYKSNPYFLGSEPRREIFTDEGMSGLENTGEGLGKETVSAIYLRRLIDECQSDGIDVVLTFMPMNDIHMQDYQAVNYGKALADEYGIRMVSLLGSEGLSVVDPDTDMSDHTHLNVFGMSKVTSYLGQILSQEAELEDHRGEDGYRAFDEAADAFESENLNCLINGKDLYETLGYAQMLDANIVLFIRKDSPALHDGFICHMIGSIIGSDAIMTAKELNGPYFMLRQTDSGTGQLYSYEGAGDKQESGIPTITGTGEYIGMSDYAAFYVNGDYEHNYLDMDENYNSSLQLYLIGDDGDVLASRYFNNAWE